MLLVVFHFGEHRYALDSGEVVEIVPLLRFKPIPRAPDYVLGVFHYRGRIVPVIDLCALAGAGPARPFMSTRIILVNYTDGRGLAHVLGLVAERVTDTVKKNESDRMPSGVQVADAPWLGDVIPGKDGITQYIRVNELLPQSVQDILFPTGENEK